MAGSGEGGQEVGSPTDAPLLCLLHQATELAGRVAQQLLQVADELVDEPLAVDLADHDPVVVIPESPRQLLVVHVGLVLPGAPQLGNHLVTRLF